MNAEFAPVVRTITEHLESAERLMRTLRASPHWATKEDLEAMEKRLLAAILNAPEAIKTTLKP